MPEWGTKPSNHYLPRRKQTIDIQKDDLERVENPLKAAIQSILPQHIKSTSYKHILNYSSSYCLQDVVVCR